MTPEQLQGIVALLFCILLLGAGSLYVLVLYARKILDEIEEFKNAILERLGPKP